MRSRYAAFALGDHDYLVTSWHPERRPPRLVLDPAIRWTGLRILSQRELGDRATVEFEASLICAGTVSAMHERSEFVREQGHWLYFDGEQLAPSFAPYRPGRNQPCPCASGVKFKRCCGKT